jgi:hypothetical protein
LHLHFRIFQLSRAKGTQKIRSSIGDAQKRRKLILLSVSQAALGDAVEVQALVVEVCGHHDFQQNHPIVARVRSLGKTQEMRLSRPGIWLSSHEQRRRSLVVIDRHQRLHRDRTLAQPNSWQPLKPHSSSTLATHLHRANHHLCNKQPQSSQHQQQDS